MGYFYRSFKLGVLKKIIMNSAHIDKGEKDV